MKPFSLLPTRFRLALCSVVALLAGLPAHGQVPAASPRTTLAMPTAAAVQARAATAGSGAEALSALGPLPASERVTLTLTLASSPGRAAELDRFLAELATPGASGYHAWLEPAQFAARFGAAEPELAAATVWLRTQGLAVESVSSGGTRLVVSGFAPQVEQAFAVRLQSFAAAGRMYHAAATEPSLPAEAAALFTAIDGLNDLPGSAPLSASTHAPVRFAALASAVDANQTPVLSLDLEPVADATAGEQAEYAALFRQAAAQGITVLARAGLAANLSEVTAVALPGEPAPALAPFAARPAWQSAASGLPADTLRHAPDLAASSVAALTQTLAQVAEGKRLGNLNPVLYALAPVPGLYTQPAGAPAWTSTAGLGTIDLDRLLKVFPHGATAVSLQVVPSTGSPVHGQSFTLSATVIGQGGVTPTGTVTFSSTQPGFQSTSAALDAAGRATSPAYLPPGGTYTVSATYTGDATYAGATATNTFTVQAEAANFTLAGPTSATLGSSFSVTARLTSASGVGTPAGSVTVTPAGITGGTAQTQTLVGSGSSASATFTFTSNRAGTINLQATCTSADASFTCFNQPSTSVNVPQPATTTTLTLTPPAPSAGVPTTLNATVTGTGSIAPTGTVTFLDGATQLGTGSAPNATFTTTLAPGVAHSLTAVYAGDTNYAGSTSPTVTPTVTAASTSTTVIASASSAAFGQSVTLNATVKGSVVVNGTQPTGTLSYTVAGPSATTSSTTVAGGVATINLASLAVGSYTVTSSYSGDTNYAASTGNTVSFSVTQATASLMAQFSSTTFTTGSTSTGTVTVTLPGNAQLPAGSTFTATVLNAAGATVATYPGTFAINPGGNTGTGQVILAAPPAGSYTVQIACPANASFTCTPITQAVTSTATGTTPGTVATTTTLTLNPTAPSAGQTVTLTATVSAAAGSTASTPITGSVVFYDGTTKLGTGTIMTSGSSAVATLTTTLAAATATRSLTAVYSGDTVYAGSTSPAVTVGVAATAASVVLSSNVSSTLAGQTITFTARVSGTTATGVAPTGSVSFYLAGTTPRLLGTSPAGTAGTGLAIATLSTTAIPAGAQVVYAVYAGDGNFLPATSNSLSIGLGDYTITFVPSSLTLTRGQTGRATMILGVVNGFAGQVTLGCTPPPNAGITCSVSPAVLTGGGSSTLTIVTTAPKTAGLNRTLPGGSRGLFGGVALAALLWLARPGSRRRRTPALLALLLALGLSAGAAISLGCGDDAVTAGTDVTGTPLGTTTVTVNTAGSDSTGSVRHDYTYQVTIQ